MKKTSLFILLIACIASYGQEKTRNISIWVDGACGMCEKRIEGTALATHGVSIANWDVDSKMLKLTVTGHFKENQLHTNLAGIGHDTRQMKAPDHIYNALPACCHYRPEDSGQEWDHELHASGIRGKVIETDFEETAPLPGANIFWAGTNLGVITDDKGMFEIDMTDESDLLVVSYVGYGRDTIKVSEPMAYEIEFNKSLGLEEVRISYRTASTSVSLKTPFNIQTMHEKELLNAACCNLSESFETNPSVDVTFTDAVTGTRQIEMLGLAGPYVQITRENIPDIRGIASLYGLSYTPGPWISSIQLNTGSGSVVNGFESIAGQINVELQKPENSDKLYLNFFGNEGGRMEANLNLSHSINKNLHSGLLLHGNYQPFRIDHNNDGFMDHPAGRNAILMNRWKLKGKDGLMAQFGFKGTYINSESGQTEYNQDIPATTQAYWGAEVNTKRMEGWMKLGKVFPNKPYTSIGFQFAGLTHIQDAFFGRRVYNASQQSFYSNFIYQGVFGNSKHQYKTGVSFQYDHYDELVAQNPYLRTESVPGTFFEYTYSLPEQLTLVGGIRTDYHNNYGLFFTPRIHVRFAPAENTSIRATAGKGTKTASIIAENIGVLASSREIIIEGDQTKNPYGLEPEVAWNSGISFAQEFTVDKRDALLKIDYYYTWFTNQILVNYDRSPDAVIFQNLDGQSFSKSLQAQLDYELFMRFDIRLAYRFNDVRSTIDGNLLAEALTPKHRAFLNMSYESPDQWRFNLTMNWQGAKRIPSTSQNPEAYRMDSESPSYFLFNAQVSKKLFNKLDIYIGVENILNYRQPNPILDAKNPFGDYFDASLIWGPIFGRKIYAGMRYRIPAL